MSSNFLCPYCKGYLNVANYIILTGEKKEGDKALMLFSPRLGDYHVQNHETFHVKKGEELLMSCPLCHKSLNVEETENHLAKILMNDRAGNTYEIYFSEIVGERCTYKIKEEKVEVFGEDSQKYMNFFGEFPKY